MKSSISKHIFPREMYWEVSPCCAVKRFITYTLTKTKLLLSPSLVHLVMAQRGPVTCWVSHLFKSLKALLGLQYFLPLPFLWAGIAAFLQQSVPRKEHVFLFISPPEPLPFCAQSLQLVCLPDSSSFCESCCVPCCKYNQRGQHDHCFINHLSQPSGYSMCPLWY